MSTVRIPSDRAPTHPGEMLLEDFLRPMELTQRDLAAMIRVPYQRVNEWINGRQGVTSSTALRLGESFGMSADFWLNLQQRWDLNQALRREDGVRETIQPHPTGPRSLRAKRAAPPNTRGRRPSTCGRGLGETAAPLATRPIR